MQGFTSLLRLGIKELKPHSQFAQSEAKILLEEAFELHKTPHKSHTFKDDANFKDDAKLNLFKSFIEKRKQGMPIAYIIGNKEFFGLTFAVSKGILIPRADSEILVEEALSLIKSSPEVATVFDLCSGSGCLLISILKNASNLNKISHKNLTGIGIDISKQAIEIAQKNASNLVPNCKINFKMQDILKEEVSITQHSIVISNPPYIKAGDICSLEKSVKDFEPIIALDGGSDGLIFYKAIAKKCKKAKFVLVEIGFDIEPEVKTVFAKEGYSLQSSHKDLGGVIRVLVFYHKGL